MAVSRNIAHVFRAPVGGLFRHVRDLVRLQHKRGHNVGIICDANTGGESAEKLLASLAGLCTLGVQRIAMHRLPGFGDAVSARRIVEHCSGLGLDILHGHGAKGGAYARLAAGRLGAKAVYTPHGGTLHYSWRNPQGALFLGAERVMLARTDGLAFVCEYEKTEFEAKIGLGGVPHNVAHNGLWPEEFQPVRVNDNACDIVYVGEMRKLKGVDVLIEALALLADVGLTAVLVGDGPDRAEFESLVRQRGLDGSVSFPGALPACEAFKLGELMVVPSRSESFPYIVLEAIAAAKPIIASRVGGIPEILEPAALIVPDDAAELARAISAFMAGRQAARQVARERCAFARQNLSAQAMGESLLAFYDTIQSPADRDADVA